MLIFLKKNKVVKQARSLTNKFIRGSHPELFHLLYILYKGSTITVTKRLGILNFLTLMSYIQGIAISVNALDKDKLISRAHQC